LTADLIAEFAGAIAVVTAGLIALLRWRRTDAKTKRGLDTALRELRDLREALPPAERILVERRKKNEGPPDGLERRKGRRSMSSGV